MIDFSKMTSLTIPEGNVVQISCGTQILWKARDRYALPDGYERVDFVLAPASVGAYIDLDLRFDTAARVEMELYIENKTVTAYPFGAVENSGATRFALSAPYNGGSGAFYFTKGSSFTETASSLTIGKNDLIMEIKDQKAFMQNLSTNESYGPTAISPTYSMSSNLLLFAQRYNGTVRYGGMRKIGTFKYYDKTGALASFLIPCIKTSNKAIGMYDVARRRFFTNAGTGSFTTGKVPNSVIEGITNLVATATTEPGGTEIYGGNLIGYRDGIRWSSSGAGPSTTASDRLTGWIPYQHGATLRMKNLGVTESGYAGGGYIVWYMADGSYSTTTIGQQTTDYYQTTLNKSNAKYFRISAYCQYADKTMVPVPPIITLNEEIPSDI